MPTSPRRVRFQSGKKDGHAHPVSFRADVGCIDRYDCLQIVRGDRLQFK